MFFFEKKNQKTFAHWLQPLLRGSDQDSKVFASFFKNAVLRFGYPMPEGSPPPPDGAAHEIGFPPVTPYTSPVTKLDSCDARST
jgi:hypothetical protein